MQTALMLNSDPYWRDSLRQVRGRLVVALTCIAVLALTGCARTDRMNTDHGVTLPQAWSAQPGDDADTALIQQAPLDDWLPDFQSPALEGLVAEALSNNRDLQVAAARITEARAIARIQTGAMLPSVSAGFTTNRTRSNISDGQGGTSKVLTTLYDANMEMSWEVDLWGRLNNQRRAAVLDYEAQAATYRYAQLSLAGNVVQSWFALVEAENQLTLAHESEASFTRAAALVRSRYEQGLRRGLDVRLSASNAASARALSAARDEQVRRASTALEVLLGRYPAGALQGDTKLPDLTPRSAQALPTQLLVRRPDLSAAQAQAAAADLRRIAALKDMLPALRLRASGNYRDTSLSTLDNPSNLIWALAGGLVQPLFQGGALKAQAEAAEARGAQALGRYAQSLLTALQEVETTLYAEKTLAVRETSMGEAAHEAVEAEKLASDLYSRGLTGIFELLEAQRRSLNARSSHLEVRRQRLSNRVTLYLALGGGIPGNQSHDTDQSAKLDPVIGASNVSHVPQVN